MMLWIGVLGVAAAVLLWNTGVSLVGVPVASLFSNSAPVFAIGLAALMGREPSWLQLAGGAIVMGGIARPADPPDAAGRGDDAAERNRDLLGAFAAMVFVGASWGANLPVTKVMLGHFDLIPMAAIRTAAAALTLGVLLLLVEGVRTLRIDVGLQPLPAARPDHGRLLRHLHAGHPVQQSDHGRRGPGRGPAGRRR